MQKSIYQSPEVEIIPVVVEAGFAQSQQDPAPWEDL